MLPALSAWSRCSAGTVLAKGQRESGQGMEAQGQRWIWDAQGEALDIGHTEGGTVRCVGNRPHFSLQAVGMPGQRKERGRRIEMEVRTSRKSFMAVSSITRSVRKVPRYGMVPCITPWGTARDSWGQRRAEPSPESHQEGDTGRAVPHSPSLAAAAAASEPSSG